MRNNHKRRLYETITDKKRSAGEAERGERVVVRQFLQRVRLL